ncbi:MAG: hypothetical protein ACUVQ6_04110 [Dissulfurimicrobium sp.]|uniref:hypothetical protein n=1 Tax=Dissulfurimicrobium sp. TaxID=2022436 RepID=UPI004049976B
MTAKLIGVSPQLPFWGKGELKLKGEGCKSFKWEIEERRNDLVKMVSILLIK